MFCIFTQRGAVALTPRCECREAFTSKLKTLWGHSPCLAWYPSLTRWGCSSRPEAAAEPEESCRVQSSKRWRRKAARREKVKLSVTKKLQMVCAKNLHNQVLTLTRRRGTPENVHRPYGRLRSKHIHMQNHSYHGTKLKSDYRLQQRCEAWCRRAQVQPADPGGSLGLQEEDDEDEQEALRRSPFSPLPISPEEEVMYRFQLQRFKADPSTLSPPTPASDLTHPTPRVPNPVTLSPDALSPGPKDSGAPSLTSSAPICQNHNLWASPLITRQGK